MVSLFVVVSSFPGEVAPLYAVHAIEAHARWGIAPSRRLTCSLGVPSSAVLSEKYFSLRFLHRSLGDGLADVAPQMPRMCLLSYRLPRVFSKCFQMSSEFRHIADDDRLASLLGAQIPWCDVQEAFQE